MTPAQARAVIHHAFGHHKGVVFVFAEWRAVGRAVVGYYRLGPGHAPGDYKTRPIILGEGDSLGAAVTDALERAGGKAIANKVIREALKQDPQAGGSSGTVGR